MPDNPKKRGPADRIRISLEQAHERAYWTKKIGVTVGDLRWAVRLVGPMARDVKCLFKLMQKGEGRR